MGGSEQAGHVDGSGPNDHDALVDDTPEIRTMAGRLVAARRDHDPVPLLTAEAPLSLLDAYDVQRLTVHLWTRLTGHRTAGYNVSLTSDEAQARLGTSEPTYGHLFEDQILSSPATISLGDLLSPLIEPEVVFIFDEDLSPHAGPDDIRRCTRVAPGLEIPDARYRSWFSDPALTLSDFIADNSAAGFLVLGDALPTDDLELGSSNVEMTLDGESLEHGRTEAVLGEPIRAVTWLSRQLALRNEGLRAGDVVSSGALCRPQRLTRGHYIARIRGLGTVSLIATA